MKSGSLTTDSFANIFRGLGIATFLFLPAWGAMFSLRETVMPWIGLADLIGTSVVVSIYFFWVSSLKGKLKFFMLIPFLILFILIGYDSVIYIYDSLKAEFRKLGILDFIKNNISIAFGFCGLPAVIVIWYCRKKTFAIKNVFGTLFGILFILLILQFVILKTFYEHKENRFISNNPSQKIVILIFDELDGDLLDAKISQLPAFKHLEQTAALVGRVYPPSNYTHISVPSMLVGKPLSSADFIGKSILFTLKDEANNKKIPNKEDLISFALDKGMRVSLIGWHLPYCAAFIQVERCIDDSLNGVPGTNLTTTQWLYGKNSFLLMYRDKKNKEKFEDIDLYSERIFNDPRLFKLKNISNTFKELNERLYTDIAGSEYDLIFAHLPCPHLPRLDSKQTQGVFKDYDDNLIQCDLMLQTILNSLQKNNEQTWKLIVTSDHWFRARDWIENMKPGELPPSARKVPFYFTESYFTGNRRFVNNGSNIRLAQIFIKLSEKSINITKEIKEEIEIFGQEFVLLDKF